jgi:hypothetical protein
MARGVTSNSRASSVIEKCWLMVFAWAPVDFCLRLRRVLRLRHFCPDRLESVDVYVIVNFDKAQLAV